MFRKLTAMAVFAVILSGVQAIADARGRSPEDETATTTTTTTTTTSEVNVTPDPAGRPDAGNAGNVDGSRDTSVGTQNNDPAGVISSTGSLTGPTTAYSY